MQRPENSRLFGNFSASGLVAEAPGPAGCCRGHEASQQKNLNEIQKRAGRGGAGREGRAGKGWPWDRDL
jgi:hypothetical protein